jgi:hypothetical protein
MIDFEKRIIKGKSGTIYKILPEKLSVGRAAEFEIRSTLLGFNLDFETIFKKISKAVKILEDSTSFGGLIDAHNELKEIQSGLIKFQENKRPQVIEFCSLFCLKEGEDTSNHNEDVIREKYEDWAHIDHNDFFLLCANVIPSFKENLINIIQVAKGVY